MPGATFGTNFNKIIVKSALENLNSRIKTHKRRQYSDKALLLEGARIFIDRFRNELHNSPVIENLTKTGSTGTMGGINSKGAAESTPLMGMLGLPPSAQGVHNAIENIKIGNSCIFFKMHRVQNLVWRGALGFSLGTFSKDPMVNFKHGSKKVSWPMILENGMRSSGHVFGWWIDSVKSRSNDGIMVKSKSSSFEFAPLHIFREAFEKTIVGMPQKYKRLLNLMFMR